MTNRNQSDNSGTPLPNRQSTIKRVASGRTTLPPSPAPKAGTPLWLIVAITLLLVLVVGGIILSAIVPSKNPTVSGGGGSDLGNGVVAFPKPSGGHQDGEISYRENPPVGGIHNSVWQNCGVYTQPIAQENAVHSLEHGAVWITYRPDLAPSEVAKLTQIAQQSTYRLLSPYSGLPSPIVASAWGYQLKLDQADDPRLTSFLAKYELNPNGPEPGAACIGGKS